jgi:phage virion morphogenesis protein
MNDIITLSVQDTEVLSVLSQLSARMTPEGMRPYMNLVGEKLVRSTKQRFITGTDPDGNPWVRNTNPRPLIKTGQLAATIHASVTDGGSTLLVGTNRSFIDKKGNKTSAAVHQFGTARAGRNRATTIPARPFLGLSASDKTTVLATLRKVLQRP